MAKDKFQSMWEKPAVKKSLTHVRMTEDQIEGTANIRVLAALRALATHAWNLDTAAESIIGAWGGVYWRIKKVELTERIFVDMWDRVTWRLRDMLAGKLSIKECEFQIREALREYGLVENDGPVPGTR